MRRVDARNERGFSYAEVLVATGITLGVVLALSGAVASALHGIARVEERTRLQDDALDTLADVRAIAAYGDGLPQDRAAHVLPSLFGRTSRHTIVRPDGTRETIEIAVDARPADASQTVAAVTASADGMSVTERQVLFYEAPAPGSTVTER